MRRIGVLMHLAADDPEGQRRVAAFLRTCRVVAFEPVAAIAAIRRTGDYGISARSLAFDVGRLDDRPPLFDFGFVVGSQRLRRLLFMRRNLLTQIS
jgi:hypothetical protein